MSLDKNGPFASAAMTAESVDTAIRSGLLALLAYWSWEIIAPFLTIVFSSAILTVALYPLFNRLKTWLNRPKLAAALVTLLCVLIVIAPVTWLGFGLVSGVKFLAKEFDAGLPSVGFPPQWVRDWPVVGEQVYQLWTRAVTDLKAQLVELKPILKPVAGSLLSYARKLVTA